MKRMMAALCLAFFLALAISASAGGAAKEEVVYGLLKADGARESVYVVNAFELMQAGEIIDYGAYEGVVNLTDGTPLSLEGDTIRFAAGRGRFYYQGSLASAALPWRIQIGYTLDGSPVKPEELGGKSGRVAMSIGIRPEDSAFAKAYMLQTTVTLAGDRCLAISAPGGAVAVSGKDRIISFTLLPGREAAYTVTAQAESFSMESIRFTGMKVSMDLSMDMASLASRVEELKSGTAAIEGGAKGLEAGISRLSDSLAQLETGLDAITGGMAQWQAGLSGMASQQPAFAMAGVALSQGAEAIKAGLDTWAAGFSAAAEGAASLKEGAASLSKGAAGLNAGVSAMVADAIAKEAVSSLFPELPEGLSFVSPDKGRADSVQFVLLAKSIDAPAAEKAEPAPAREESFWDRLAALFAGK